MQLFASQCKRVYLVVEVISVFMDRPTHKISPENIMLGAINRRRYEAWKKDLRPKYYILCGVSLRFCINEECIYEEYFRIYTQKNWKKKPTTNRKTGCQELRVTGRSSSLAYFPSLYLFIDLLILPLQVKLVLKTLVIKVPLLLQNIPSCIMVLWYCKLL